MIQLGLNLTQRWREGADTWTPAAPFDPSRYEVGPVSHAEAVAFVERHHYSRSYPAARFRFGLYQGAELVGVAAYSVPVNLRALAPLGLADPLTEGIELGRLVLLDQVPGNAESWMVAQTFRQLRQEGIRGILSFSDPQERTNDAGELVTPGHVGIVYQALSAVYAGQATARTLHRLASGRVINARAMQKVRKGERGWRGTVDTLRAAGAPRYSEGADRAAWLAEALRATCTTHRHPGNHRYLWGLDKHTRRGLPPSLPYPRHPAGRALPRWGRRAEVAA